VVHHFHNTTFKVGDGYALRLSRPGYQSDGALRSELRFLEYLGGSGLPVPRPVRTNAGDEMAAVGEQRAALFPWVHGRFANASFGKTQAQAQGRLVARLHGASTKYRTPRDFTRLEVTPDTLLLGKAGDEAEGTPPEVLCSRLTKHQVSVIERSAELVRTTWERLSKPALIHTDITPWNTMWIRSEPYLIDFDDMAVGPFEYDLGVVRCEYLDLPNPDELWSAFLQGYGELRPVPAALEEQLPGVVAARHLLFAVWLVGNIDHPAFPEASTWTYARTAALEDILRANRRNGQRRP
jgi:Ser/Thr protein kinase RdoA (MazF antagonist)